MDHLKGCRHSFSEFLRLLSTNPNCELQHTWILITFSAPNFPGIRLYSSAVNNKTRQWWILFSIYRARWASVCSECKQIIWHISELSPCTHKPTNKQNNKEQKPKKLWKTNTADLSCQPCSLVRQKSHVFWLSEATTNNKW